MIVYVLIYLSILISLQLLISIDSIYTDYKVNKLYKELKNSNEALFIYNNKIYCLCNDIKHLPFKTSYCKWK